MTDETPTLAELREVGTISGVEIARAVSTYVAAPDRGPYRFSSGHMLDVAEAIAAHPEAAAVFANPDARQSEQRTTATVAVMSARPAPP